MLRAMTGPTTLGRSDLEVPRLGVGAMTWGDPSGRARWTPAKLAYGGGPANRDEEQRAFDASVAAGATLVDTAEMYGAGASERRVGELAHGRDVLIATKFPPNMLSQADAMPRALERSLELLRRPTLDLYMHLPIPPGLDPEAHGPHGRRRRAGQGPGGRGQQLLGRTDAAGPSRPGRSRHPAGLEPGRVLAAPPPAGDRRRARHLSGAWCHAHRQPAVGQRRAHRQVRGGARPSGFRRFMPRFRGKEREAVMPVVALLREIGEAHDRSPPRLHSAG